MLRFYLSYSITSQRIRRAFCCVSMCIIPSPAKELDERYASFQTKFFFTTFSLPLSKKIYVEFLAPSHALGADTQKFYGFLNEQLFP